MRCGWRWRRTTRCLREAVEAHDGTVFKLHRRRDVRGIRLTARGRRCRGRSTAGTGVTGADGHRDRRGRTARRRLLRHGAQPHRAGDGGRPRRPDPARRRYGRAAQRSRPRCDWGRGGCGISPNRSSVFQVRAPGLRTEFPPLKTLDSTPGNLRPPTTSFVGRECRTRRVGDSAEGTPAGDLDRCRRSRQDPTRARGRRAVGERLPRRGVGDRAGRGRRSGRGARRGRRRARNHPAAGNECGRQCRRGIGGPRRGCWCSTTANTFSTRRPT